MRKLLEEVKRLRKEFKAFGLLNTFSYRDLLMEDGVVAIIELELLELFSLMEMVPSSLRNRCFSNSSIPPTLRMSSMSSLITLGSSSESLSKPFGLAKGEGRLSSSSSYSISSSTASVVVVVLGVVLKKVVDLEVAAVMRYDEVGLAVVVVVVAG